MQDVSLLSHGTIFLPTQIRLPVLFFFLHLSFSVRARRVSTQTIDTMEMKVQMKKQNVVEIWVGYLNVAAFVFETQDTFLDKLFWVILGKLLSEIPNWLKKHKNMIFQSRNEKIFICFLLLQLAESISVKLVDKAEHSKPGSQFRDEKTNNWSYCLILLKI